MSGALLEVTVLLALISMNGVLAASEIAVVTSRKSRLHARAQGGDPGAHAALELAGAPTRFLSTVQVGITAIAVMAGALGGTRLQGTLEVGLLALGIPDRFAAELALALVVGAITLLTVLAGELIPKRIALHDPEALAARVARPMQWLARIATPLVRFLSRTTELALSALPLRPREEGEVTEDEIRAMIAHATSTGVLEATEQQITERLFRLSDTHVEALMTPREAIAWLDLADGPAAWTRALGEIRHTRYVVGDGSLDRFQGYVRVQELLASLLAGEEPSLSRILRTPHLLPPWTPAFRVLERFQWTGDHIALVTDPTGRVVGLVTLNDILEGIVGDLPERDEVPVPGWVERADGSWLVDGLLPWEEVVELLSGRAAGPLPPVPEPPPTLHSFLSERLAQPPRVAGVLEWEGFRLEVVDMDGSRIDKVLVQPATGSEPTPSDA